MGLGDGFLVGYSVGARVCSFPPSIRLGACVGDSVGDKEGDSVLCGVID